MSYLDKYAWRRLAAMRAKLCPERIGMYVYCLFCQTVKCAYVARVTEEMFGCRAILPKQVRHIWSKGKMIDLESDLLPGYVFLYFDQKQERIWRFSSVDGVIRCLGKMPDGYELTGSDERFAMMLLSSGGVIGKTQVYREGDRIRVCQGAFEGLETKILKVNHRNAKMLIEIPFVHRPVRCWVEYEMVETKEEKPSGGV